MTQRNTYIIKRTKKPKLIII